MEVDEWDEEYMRSEFDDEELQDDLA